MTRDEMIAKAMARTTNAGPGDVELLRMASTMFLEQIAELADDIAARREDSRYRMFDEAIPGGRLHANADAMPGITIHLVMSGRTSYQMRSIWSVGTKLPQTLSDGVIGRIVSEVVELPEELPAVIRGARIIDIFHAGNRKTGFSTRFDLDQSRQGI